LHAKAASDAAAIRAVEANDAKVKEWEMLEAVKKNEWIARQRAAAQAYYTQQAQSDAQEYADAALGWQTNLQANMR